MEKYSFSRLSTFNTCILEFIFKYIICEEEESNAMSEYGKYIHSLLDKWVKGEIETYNLLANFEEEYDICVPTPFPYARNKNYMGDEYYEDAVSFLSNFNGIREYEILESEIKFEIEIEDFIFVGIIDLLLQDEDGNIIVWDWKSKKGFKDEAEEAKYRRQLYLYSYYVNEKYGKLPTSTIFYCFRQQKSYEKSFDMDAYNESVKWMFDTVAKIRELYAAYNWFYCNQLCSSRNICAVKEDIESNSNWKEMLKNMKNGKVGSGIID